MTVWGIVPAAGAGQRIQPIAFSKELLPVGHRIDGPTKRPRAVSEYLLERMVVGGAGQSRTGLEGFAILCITALLPRRCLDKKGSRGFPFWCLEREKSLELSTSTLARLRSTN